MVAGDRFGFAAHLRRELRTQAVRNREATADGQAYLRRMTMTMTSISNVTLEVTDAAAAQAFHTALGVDDRILVRRADAPTEGFRAFSLSLVAAQPGNVDVLFRAATDAGATVLKPAKKSLWGYGGVVQAPDGTIWKFATSSKKDSAPASADHDDIVLLLGASDVKASKRFYVDRGLSVDKGFGSKYVQFDAAPGDIKLALSGRDALAKDVGVSAAGTGSHRVAIASPTGAFVDPDGFVWESDAA